MRLFIHCLRTDLQRFAGMLWFWGLSLASYGLFVGILNARLGFIAKKYYEWTLPLGMALLLLETAMLFHLFRSDPCAGTSPQWKTRPPAGWSVGLSKIVIAAVFYLGAPLLAWWLVLTTTGNGIHRLGIGEGTWLQRLWWAQALLIAACLFVSSAAHSGWSLAGRIFATLLILGAMVGIRGMQEEGGWSPTDVLKSQPPALWLALGGAMHLFCRVKRTPGFTEKAASLILPGLLAWGGATMPFHPQPVPSWKVDRPLPSVLASQIRIGEPLLMTGHNSGSSFGSANGEKFRGYFLTLHLHGLPEDCRTNGIWRELCLTTPDGRKIRSIDVKEHRFGMNVEDPTPWAGTHRLITTAGAIFHESELAEAGLTNCRLDGVLRIRVWQRRGKVFPLKLGAVMQGPAGHIRVDKVGSLGPEEKLDNQDSGENLLVCAILQSESAEDAWWELQHREHKISVPLRTRQDRMVDGWFIEPRMTVITPRSKVFNPGFGLPELRLRKASRDGKLDEWDFHTGWFEDLGFVDLTVSFPGFVLPHQSQLDLKVEKMDRIVPSLPGPGQEAELRSTLKYALTLEEYAWRIYGEEGSPRLKELWRQVPPASLPTLLELLKTEFPYHADAGKNANFAHQALGRKISELLTAENVETIRKDPVLTDHLRYYFIASGFMSKEDEEKPGIPAWSDSQLHASWLAANNSSSEALAEAVKRGLPWVSDAFQELGAYPRNKLFLVAMGAALALEKTSDLPIKEVPDKVEWLMHHGARLKWDVAAKRWVLPLP